MRWWPEARILHHMTKQCAGWQANGHCSWLVLLRLLSGLSPVTDLEELQQALRRGPLPRHVCMCHHCQHLLWSGHCPESILLGCGLVKRSLAARKPWHCVSGPRHLHSGQQMRVFVQKADRFLLYVMVRPDAMCKGLMCEGVGMLW